MVEGFFELEASEHGELPDLFFRMEAPFTEINTYFKALLTEWETNFENDPDTLASLAEAGIPINRESAVQLLQRNDLDFSKVFFDQLSHFIHAIPDFESNIVLYISPQSCSNYKNFSKWLKGLLEKQFSNRIRIMIADTDVYTYYDYLQERCRDQVVTLNPDLQMDKALKQAATAGNPAAPDVQFRKCFFNMSDAAAKKNLGDIEYWGSKALEIAVKAGWKHLEAVAYMLTAGYLLNFKKYNRSIALYNNSLQVSEAAYSQGDEACGALVIQSLSLIGSCYTLAKDYGEAATVYAQMAGKATAMNDWLNAMEGWRMAAFSSERSGRADAAWQYYTNAMESGKNLDKPVRESSALPFVGAAMTELAKHTGKQSMMEKINHDMIAMVGNNWREKAAVA